MNVKENISKDERIKISPLAKDYLKNNVNFSSLLGTGPHGKIVKDIEDLIKSNKNITSVDSHHKSHRQVI